MLSQIRLSVVLFLLAGATLALVVRIAHLQIIEHHDFVQQADNAHWSKQEVLANRGAILDRDGHPLALSLSTWEVSLIPSQVEASPQREATLATLAKATGKPPQELQQISATGERRSVVIANNLSYDSGKSLSERLLPGVYVQRRLQRSYPEGNIAATLLGFIGKDQVGLTGLEADYNRELAGISGQMIFERDSIGNPIPLGYRSTVQPKTGSNVYLTIDRYIQRIVERQLDAAVKQHSAEGGTIIVMDPKSGAILAIASRPSFDLRNPNLDDPKQMELFRNRALTDLYEPGSTFKVITMSAALNEGLVTPETTHNDSGPAIKYGRAIDNWDFRHFGVETMTQVLIRSNNVGAVWVSDQLGNDRFYRYLEKFGLGKPTNLGLSGEASGFYRTPQHPQFSPIDLATNAFGQGIVVTPLQLITAFTAAVNGGTLYQPYIVSRVQGPDGVESFGPTPVRQVISAKTSQQMREILKQVAELGTAGKASIPGYNVGVKTGTATVPGVGVYEPDKTIASIEGFAPYEDPKITVLVKIDHPKDSPWGSQVAAPIFAAVAREILVYWRVPPTESAVPTPAR